MTTPEVLIFTVDPLESLGEVAELEGSAPVVAVPVEVVAAPEPEAPVVVAALAPAPAPEPELEPEDPPAAWPEGRVLD